MFPFLRTIFINQTVGEVLLDPTIVAFDTQNIHKKHRWNKAKITCLIFIIYRKSSICAEINDINFRFNEFEIQFLMIEIIEAWIMLVLDHK